MTKEDAIEFFGTQTALAKALGLSPSTVCEWAAIPIGRQFQLQVLTRGKLKADRK